MNTTFTEEEYNSNDGMMTSVWGPALWHSLHTISFNYPANPSREQKNQYKNFILSLKHVLPCGACRKNLVKNLEAVPLTEWSLKNRKNFSKWMYRLHEQVNTMLGKKSGLSYEDVRARYENFRARCSVTQAQKQKIESGCVEPLIGIKSKCVLNIIPKDVECNTFNMHQSCNVTRGAGDN